MKIFQPLLCAALVILALSPSPAALAQVSNKAPVVGAKVDDFGLKDRLMPTKYRASLKLSPKQLDTVKNLDVSWQKTLDKLAKEAKTLSHEHADGEECPACVHAEKVQAAYKGYFQGLGSLLNTTQKEQLRSFVKKEQTAKK
jgi:hypothetical protein